jgi:rare lipoprotein A
MVFKKILLGITLATLSGISLTEANLHFADIDTTHPHFLAIDHLTNAGIVNGYTVDGKLFFKSLQPVNRAEAVKTILLTAEIDPEIETASFDDIADEAWFAPFIGTAEYFELVNGFGDGNFHPQAQVTRAEFLSILLKSFQIPIEVEDGQEWFDPLIEFSNTYNIIDSAELSPHDALTRGDVVEIAYRMKKIAAKNFSDSYVYSGTGSASYYNEGFAGKQTANGEIYDPMAMTAAHRTLPFGTRLKVWEVNNPNKSVVVRITDRGPYHSSRIIDLSEKAFSSLAPISRGVLEVGFEVFSDEETAVAPIIIPSDIQSEFSKDALPPLVPEEIIPELSTATPEQKAQMGDTIIKDNKTQALFSGSTAHIPKSFYEGLEMRESFPQKIQLGSIMSLSGRADDVGYKEVTVFLQPISEQDNALQKQQVFKSTVNFQNFVVPIRFLEAGKYQMGVVFDDSRRSKVAEIEVIKGDIVRRFNTTDTQLSADFELNVLPDEQMVQVSWDNDFGTNRINKIEIRPQDSSIVTKTLYIQSGMDSIKLPYDFFTVAVGDAGEHDGNWSFDFFAATSVNQTLASQNSTWKKTGYQNFRLIPGFEDSESKDFSLEDFERFTDKGYALYTGRTLNNKRSRDAILITNPNGTIEESKIVEIADDAFKFRVDFDEEGTYIIEVIADDGEILFNRAIYKYDETVLPVLSWFRQKANTTNAMGVKNWINAFRRSRRVSDIYTNAELNELAQEYADKMSRENFIGHIGPDGTTFEDRISRAGLDGEYGENVAFGSDFQLALDGLQDSASHFQNIIHRKWTKVGIGIAKNSDGYFVVQIFGR